MGIVPRVKKKGCTKMGRAKKNARRGRGMGSLSKDARTGIWVGRIRLNGKLYTKSTHTRERVEAEKVFGEFVSNFSLDGEKSTLERIEAKMVE